MNAVIACSLKDSAGKNIRDRLIEYFPFKMTGKEFESSPVYSFGEIMLVSSQMDIVHVNSLEESFGIGKYVFLSRHRAESGIPSLTAHFPGNFGSADFGGNPGELARFSPSLLKNYLTELKTMQNEIDRAYNITLEATHHGPTALKSTALFVELGTTEDQWKDAKTALPIAKALIAALTSQKKYGKCAVGIGGSHYSEKMNKWIFDSNVALGHIIPKHSMGCFNESILAQMIRKGDQKINIAIVDSKGMGKYKQSAMKMLERSGLEIVIA